MIDISIDTKTLLAAVKASIPHLTTEVHLPAMSRLCLKAKDGHLSIIAWKGLSGRRQDLECEVHGEGSIVFGGKSFASLLSNLRGDTVRLTADETTFWVTIKCGRSKTKQAAYPVTDYPDVPDLPGDAEMLEVDPSELGEALRHVLFSASSDDARVNIFAVHIAKRDDAVDVVTTDGHRMAAYTVSDGAWPLPTSTISAPGAKNLLQELDGERSVRLGVGVDGRYLIAQVGNSTWTAARIVEVTFPPYVQVIPKRKKGTLTVPREDLLGALRVVLPTAEQKAPSCSLIRDGDTIVVHVDSERGLASSEVDVEIDGEAPAVIGVNIRYLADALEHASDDKVQIDVETYLDPMVVREGAYRAVVMPMRTSAADAQGKASRA